ncbi:histidinol dehydrogenase [Methanoculleus horonobensis]|uniref:histidinol dehydrogenase n=1 Tax=Methanoculleus horonobensis TaxID=528314 RepID=UPI000833B12E|nr:histidinol dehydrogenase [Methanoculleus horonobensis]MDD3071453.1 histidinol dehydrogenase [Methanoculleus horonobensis]MDD4252329.1 histidinol dehydrogenase [Methanoculleus horonobensis]
MWQALDIETWIAGRRSEIGRVKDPVFEIIGRVRAEGDAALLDLTKRFDKIDLEEIAVSDEELEAAYDEVDAELVTNLVEAEERISRFHELQRGRDLWLQEMEPGITLGVKTTPLSRIGAYVPGGRAAYPSTALMCTIPAKVAGVAEICCCTPPPINPITLVALDIAGVDEVYRVGGAQAIAAMALGTESIPRVEKIVGPGNVYVTAAKMLLRDEAEIDFPAGPSEIAILADGTANPTFVAADILAQAEHDPNAACVLVTTDAAVADAVGAEVKRMAGEAKRRDIVAKALEHSGYIVAADIDEAVATVDGIAPEHLSVQVADPLAVLNRIRSAGSIFVGPYAAVACGDYASGTNHVLPTAGYARLYSGLDVNHFCRRSTVQMITREGLDAIGDIVETIADAEGLHAHAESVRVRRRG